ncbi:haloacid dehalogenase-like hydrolase domain-containing 5 isoform X2 [Artemia franciscana]|uniref:Haloacid dehalogenase-like hydrolase domain-containing 5 n=1 Tax=Artemia franciscana TaxID=6661 RepID=A0AA88I189_ARTSF|nr:hypothetical protein QYM36_005480 [Artemia franciscana]
MHPSSQNGIHTVVQDQNWVKNSMPFGLLFDIDGVIVRGRQVLPTAIEAFRNLVDKTGKFKVPTVFVTNAGNNLRSQKAKQLSEWLNIKITEDQVVMGHSPLRMFSQYHNHHVLVCGQGPILDIAENLGFTKVSTIDSIRTAFPSLDAVDCQRRASLTNLSWDSSFPPIEGVVLFGEPVAWESHLQLILDILLSHGRLSDPVKEIPYPHLPILACNMDLLWMAEAWLPRFGHGAFLLCLEELYKKTTGRELVYTALIGKPSEITYYHAETTVQRYAASMGISNLKRIYMVGDNANTDIFGANLYDRYLKNRRLRAPRAIANQISGSLSRDVEAFVAGIDQAVNGTVDIGVEECLSILVETGVHSSDQTFAEHSPRDFLPVEEGLRQPTYCVANILEAVQLVLERESVS